MRRLLAVVLLIGCGPSESSKPPPTPVAPPPSPPSKANAHADAAEAKPLPASGMVCRGTRVHVWTEDDQVAPLRAIRPAPGRDGQVYETYESVHSLAPGGTPVKYPAGGKSPRVFITRGTSLLVQASATRVDVFRDGAWKEVTLPSPIAEVQAAEVGPDWWLAGGDALLRVTAAGAVEPVATPKGKVQGILPVGDALWAVTTHDVGGTYTVGFSRRDATGAFKRVVDLPDFTNGPAQHAIGSTRAAILLTVGARAGLLYLIDETNQPTTIAEGVEELGTFDAADRLWYRTPTAMIARAADGSITEYPIASKPMFGGSFGAMCYPFGGGFARLPGAAAALTGRLTLDVSGANNLAFVACEHRYSGGVTPCARAPRRVTGTFDATGHWSGEVPIGDYTFAVQRGSAWLEPAFDAKTARACKVEADQDCKLTALMPR